MWRGPALAATILAVCLLPELPRWRWLITAKRPSELALLERRLRPLLDELPADARIGFTGDGDLDRKHKQASYVAAPRILQLGTAPPLLLGLFDRPPGLFFYEHPLRVVKNYGEGVLLLEKRR